jgi:iron complex transport system ATP-binding protein
VVSTLRLDGVTATHPGAARAALGGIDLELRGASVHAILGPNGAGKTTLLRVAAGLLRPSTGRVSFAGQSVHRLRPRQRARCIAIVPQGLEAIPPTSVEDFVDGGRYAWRDSEASDRRAVRDALERTGLATFAERPLASLSGGERQRALVARALAQDAPILLCDEPTASLDVDQQIAVLEILAAESCRGRAVVLVTHELNLASQFADRVTLLHEGRIRAEGRPDEVLCAAVLAPVYGEALHYGRLPDGPPLLVPLRRRPGPESPST